jgi:general secretion pathway protein C
VATGAYALRFDGELANQLISRAPRWLFGLLVVLLFARLAILVAQLAGPPVPDIDIETPAAPPPVRNVVDVPSIQRANLFGQSPQLATPDNAPVTSMALHLGGVFPYADEKRGFAIVGTSSADGKFYKVGDMLPGGAQLHAVLGDRVLLDRNGTIEALLMPVRVGSSPPPPPPPPLTASSGAVPVQRMQQLMRDNPGILGQVIQRSMVVVDGKLQGIRVYPGANVQAFNRLGLRPGDLVTAINGTQLDDRTRSEEVFNTLSTAAEARVTVTRNATQMELNLNLAEIANEAETLAQQATEPAPAPVGPVQAPAPESTR